MSTLVAPPEATATTTELELNVDARTATLLGVPIRFTRREFDLLLFLTEHAGICFTRLQLLRSVWGHEFSGERTVDVHVRRVRVKLAGFGPTIATVHGFGYRLDDTERVRITHIR
ncbi:winged helix-turn-helix domain-containing protein [Hamadaea sp. NPDC050747]|uniref:winged helix-turn-helix domain-containing protein n=1 Tax=Hamadaea sp. NPDC050747 TaxID=3155789 RepID=UPI00341026A5